MLKDLKQLVCGDIGLVVLSSLGSSATHLYGVEGASMARRAPFPLSSIPAYIEHSMKFLCVTNSLHTLLHSDLQIMQFRLHNLHIVQERIYQNVPLDIVVGET